MSRGKSVVNYKAPDTLHIWRAIKMVLLNEQTRRVNAGLAKLSFTRLLAERLKGLSPEGDEILREAGLIE